MVGYTGFHPVDVSSNLIGNTKIIIMKEVKTIEVKKNSKLHKLLQKMQQRHIDFKKEMQERYNNGEFDEYFKK
jgi:hypothetical protein